MTTRTELKKTKAPEVRVNPPARLKARAASRDVKETEESERGVGPLGQLDYAKCPCEEQDRNHRNAFGKREAHSFSFSIGDWFNSRGPQRQMQGG